MNRPMHRLLAALLCLAALPAVATPADDEADLKRITRTMLDAIAPGDWTTWDKYTDDALVYSAEDGSVMSKEDLKKDFRPLPPGYIGRIEPVNFVVKVHGDTAVVNYKAMESLNLHGQLLDAQYMTTSTFRRGGEGGWRMVATQVLALPLEPAAISLDEATLKRYVGRYRLTADTFRTVVLKNGKLVMRQGERPPQTLTPEFERVFFVPGQLRSRVVFVLDASGKVTELRSRREGRDVVWTRIVD